MEENIGKPIDPSVSGEAVANPPKPTIRLMREKVRGPFGPCSAVTKTISMQSL
jgi:hypothetical protein